VDSTILKIATAALFHDIGKFVHGRFIDMPPVYQDNNANQYQPFRDGRHTHAHALHTAWFIENPDIAAVLPAECNWAQWGEGDCFLNLAAGHHNPETSLQWVISEADRLSSGYDRDLYADSQAASPRDYLKVRLLPVFEALCRCEPPKSPDDYTYAYPLAALSPGSIFPQHRESVVPAKQAEALSAYQELVDAFLEELKTLSHRENFNLWLEHFDSLLLRYCSCIPQDRSGRFIPDVSLYDHMRATAALATALYGYHQATGTLVPEAIQSKSEEKFLLIHGDFYGIQDFIHSCHGDTRRYRTKLLRGRSFSVSLYCDLAADFIMAACGLPFTACIYNAAGKFSIIAPNLPATREAVTTVDRQINDWFFEQFHGETSLGITTVAATPADFTGGRYPELMERVALALERRKCQRIDLDRCGGVVPGYLDRFADGGKLCPLCGKRPVERLDGASSYTGKVESCRLCRDHVLIGTFATRPCRISVVSSDSQDHLSTDRRLLAPVYGAYQVGFGAATNTTELLHCWDINSPTAEKAIATDATLRFSGGYVPKVGEDADDPRIQSAIEAEEDLQPENPKTFGMIAAMARRLDECGQKPKLSGVAALGALCADVDNLGLLMATGLPRERITLSRMATLSRQLNHFFAVYLPHYLQQEPRFKDIYTVFAGGDDLFLIGPWNRCLELTIELEQSFADYVCRNPEIHFSAGLGVHKPTTPLAAMAAAAEAILKQSKDDGRRRLTVFDSTVTWDQLQCLWSVRSKIEQWLNDQLLGTTFLHRLCAFLEMAGDEQHLEGKTAVPIHKLDCTRWRAQLAYEVRRNVARNLKDDHRDALRKKVHTTLADWLITHGDALRIAVWSLLYERRGE
jgi:CRISPR-associated protein Csm1